MKNLFPQKVQEDLLLNPVPCLVLYPRLLFLQIPQTRSKGHRSCQDSETYITQVAKRGGDFPEFATFSDFFFLKNRFLSDYVVPACPKYISGKLRSFSKNFSKNFFHTALFENFLPNGVSVADAKNEPAQGLGTPENRP